MRQKGTNTGGRKMIEDAEYARQRKFHILKECEGTKNELRIEEFVGEEAKGLKLIKWIEKLRREKTEEVNEKIIGKQED